MGSTWVVALAILGSVALLAQAPTFQRGDTVRVLPSDSPDGATTLQLRIVAVPNDRVHVVDSRLVVNDVPVAGFSTDFLARVAGRLGSMEERIPDGHYYVMGERRQNGDIREYWGIHPAARLARTP